MMLNWTDTLRRVAVAFALLTALPSMAQDASALINRTLDQPVKIQIDTVLPEAMNTIGRTTGVRIQAEQAVWDLLPWGEQTNINAKIENQTLRQALDAITRKLGLMYVLKDQTVELYPMPALRRVGRRATIEELGALDLLTSQPMGLKQDQISLSSLIRAVDEKLCSIKAPYAVEYRSGDVGRPDKLLSVPRNATVAEALECISRDTALTWHPWGKSILILPKEEQVRNQLSRTITMRFAGVDVAQVLGELSQRSGVALEIEPGALQRLSPEARKVHLMLDNSSILQALESISGVTGLGYVITPRGVYIWNQSWSQPGQRDRFIGVITLPDSGVQMFLFESQLPADMRDYLKVRRDRELEKIRQMMIEEGFRPTTTTAPTSAQTPEDL